MWVDITSLMNFPTASSTVTPSVWKQFRDKLNFVRIYFASTFLGVKWIKNFTSLPSISQLMLLTKGVNLHQKILINREKWKEFCQKRNHSAILKLLLDSNQSGFFQSQNQTVHKDSARLLREFLSVHEKHLTAPRDSSNAPSSTHSSSLSNKAKIFRSFRLFLFHAKISQKYFGERMEKFIISPSTSPGFLPSDAIWNEFFFAFYVNTKRARNFSASLLLHFEYAWFPENRI